MAVVIAPVGGALESPGHDTILPPWIESNSRGSRITGPVTGIHDIDNEGRTITVVDETLSAQASLLYFDPAEVEVFTAPEDAEAAVLSGSAEACLTSIPEARIFVRRFSDRLSMPLVDPVGAAPDFGACQSR